MKDKKNILIVEDELLIAYDTKDILKEEGFFVIDIVDTGEKALTLIKESKSQIDLIIMDVMLKGKMTGIEATRKIKEMNEIPILFTTAYKNTTVIQDITELKCEYLIKPYKSHTLIKNIHNIIS